MKFVGVVPTAERRTSREILGDKIQNEGSKSLHRNKMPKFLEPQTPYHKCHDWAEAFWEPTWTSQSFPGVLDFYFCLFDDASYCWEGRCQLQSPPSNLHNSYENSSSNHASAASWSECVHVQPLFVCHSTARETLRRKFLIWRDKDGVIFALFLKILGVLGWGAHSRYMMPMNNCHLGSLLWWNLQKPLVWRPSSTQYDWQLPIPFVIPSWLVCLGSSSPRVWRLVEPAEGLNCFIHITAMMHPCSTTRLVIPKKGDSEKPSQKLPQCKQTQKNDIVWVPGCVNHKTHKPSHTSTLRENSHTYTSSRLWTLSLSLSLSVTHTPTPKHATTCEEP